MSGLTRFFHCFITHPIWKGGSGWRGISHEAWSFILHYPLPLPTTKHFFTSRSFADNNTTTWYYSFPPLPLCQPNDPQTATLGFNGWTACCDWQDDEGKGGGTGWKTRRHNESCVVFVTPYRHCLWVSFDEELSLIYCLPGWLTDS